jgi:hypothetical protein
MANTLLLPPRITDDSVKLWRATIAAHWDTIRLDRWIAPEGLDPAEIVVYGGYFIALAQDLGISLLVPPNGWLASLPLNITKRKVQFMPLAEARNLPDRAFYKPADDKCFLAKAYSSGAELPPKGELPDDVPVLISEIVEWEIEFRCFILDGKVVTLSPYLRNHQRLEADDGSFPASDAEFQQAETFANHVVSLQAPSLPPGVVIDIGIIKDKGWAVIEANQAWGAGIYGCDPAAVLPVLRRVCLPTKSISDADRRWSAM